MDPIIPHPSKQRGFTIVELLIVIVVIAVLAAIIAVTFNGVQNRAAASLLQSDLKNAASQLSVKRVDTDTYPTPNLSSDIVKNEGTIFQYDSDGTSFCLTATSSRSGVSAYHVTNTGTVTEGACPGHSDGTEEETVALECPSGFIVVPGNSTYGTTDFCVMKYEAKNVGGVPTSRASGQPWTNHTQSSALSIASSACDGCHLITEAEWMTIATNVTSVSSNWSGGSVGSGYVYQGHVNQGPAMTLAASEDDNNGLFGITGNTGSTVGSNSRRTLTLTNGETIWDLSGSVWEWTQGTIAAGKPGRASDSIFVNRSYNDSNLQWNSLPITSRPTPPYYPSSSGVGAIRSNPQDTNLRAFARGGTYNSYGTVGALALTLEYNLSYTNGLMGFRVAR